MKEKSQGQPKLSLEKGLFGFGVKEGVHALVISREKPGDEIILYGKLYVISPRTVTKGDGNEGTVAQKRFSTEHITLIFVKYIPV